jgi:hypothetical protein
MQSMRPVSVPMARFLVIGASLLLLLATVNAVVNTDSVASWLPLFVLMPWSLYFGIWSLRNQNRRDAPNNH